MFDGVIAGVFAFVALLGLLGCAIYGLAGETVQDGAGGIAGGTGTDLRRGVGAPGPTDRGRNSHSCDGGSPAPGEATPPRT